MNSPQLSEGHLAVDHPASAEEQDEAHRQQEHEQHERRARRPHALGLHEVTGDLPVSDLELGLFVRLCRERLDHPDAGEVLLQHGAHLGHLFLNEQPDAPHFEPDERRVDHHDRYEAGADKAQPPVLQEQNHGDGREQHRKVGRSHEAHVDEHADVLHIRYGARHQRPGVVPVVEPEAHVLHVVVQHVSQVVRHQLGERLPQVGLEVGQDAPDYAEPQDDPDDHQDGIPEVGAGPEHHFDLVDRGAEVHGHEHKRYERSDHAGCRLR